MFMHPVKFYLHKSFVGKGTDLGWAPEVREVRILDDPSHTHTHMHVLHSVLFACHSALPWLQSFRILPQLVREITWMRVWNSMVS